MSLGPSWRRWLWRSPLLVRELRQAARTGRTIVVLLILAVLVGLFVVSIAGAFGTGRVPVNLGPVLFQVFFSLAYFIVLVLGPTLAAVAVASEKDGRTWDALVLAGMDGRAVARGKFWTAATAVAAFLSMIAPASLICLLLGGVKIVEIGMAFALLSLIATIGVAFGVAVGAWARSTASATLAALGTALLGAPALFFGVGFSTSFLAHATWPAIPDAHPVWLPLAYTRAPFDGLYLLLLVVLPLTVTSLALWFFYELTVLQLAQASDDRATGIKRWYLVSLPLVTLMAAIPGLMTRGVGSTTAWVAGLAALLSFVTFAAFVLIGDALAASPRVEFQWRQSGASWAARALGPGLVQTCTLHVVTALTALAAFALGGAAVLSKGLLPGLPPAPAVSLVLCAEYWSAFLLFIVGFLLWSRVRSESAGAARLLTSMVALVAIAAPWAFFVVFAYPASKRGYDAMILAAPSPFYSLAMVRAVERGEPHIALTSGLACSLGWAAMGLTLFGFGARRATKAIAARRTDAADLEARMAEGHPAVPPLLLLVVIIATFGCSSRLAPCAGPGSCERTMTCTAGRCIKAGSELVPIDAQRIVVAPQEMAVFARGQVDAALPSEIPLGGAARASPVVLLRFPTPWGKRIRIARAFLTLEPAPGAVPETRPVLVSVARVLEPWSASDTSWGRLPRLSAFEGSAYSGIGPAKALRIDVTSIVQRWALGRSTDQGLALTASSDAPFGPSYATGVAGATGPRLDVYFR